MRRDEFNTWYMPTRLQNQKEHVLICLIFAKIQRSIYLKPMRMMAFSRGYATSNILQTDAIMALSRKLPTLSLYYHSLVHL